MEFENWERFLNGEKCGVWKPLAVSKWAEVWKWIPLVVSQR